MSFFSFFERPLPEDEDDEEEDGLERLERGANTVECLPPCRVAEWFYFAALEWELINAAHLASLNRQMCLWSCAQLDDIA